MIRYTKDDIRKPEYLTNTVNSHAKKIRNARTDIQLFGIPVPYFASDPVIPTELNTSVFIYWNGSVFRKYTGGSWSNL